MAFAFHKFQAIQNKYQSEFGNRQYANYFSLKDGESAVIRFNGFKGEPFAFTEHSYKRGAGARDFASIVCAQGAVDHAGCVACHMVDRGDKAFSRPIPRGAFNVVDSRWLHKVRSEKKSAAAQKDRFDYLVCSDDITCKFCRKKDERVRSGQRIWKVGGAVANILIARDREASCRCKSCGDGVIKLVEIECTVCGKEPDVETLGIDNEGNNIAQCDKCKMPTPYKETLSCSKCKNPSRGSLLDLDVRVTRVGADKKTTYLVDTQYPFTQPEEWMEEYEPFELEAICKPLSASQQAEQLHIPNPFMGNAPGAADKHTKAYAEETEDDLPY